MLLRMLPDIPTNEPASINAGDTVTWRISLPDYPAGDGWTLKYALVGANGVFSIVSAADGDEHLVTLAIADTTAFPAGDYKAQKYVEMDPGTGLQRVTLGIISLTVVATLIGAAATDSRSFVKKALDAIEAVLEGRASRSDQEMTINTGTTTRTIKSMTTTELLALRDEFASRYWRERNPGKMCPQVQFHTRRPYFYE